MAEKNNEKRKISEMMSIIIMKRSGISVLIIINVLMIIEITQKHQRVLTVMVRKKKKRNRGLL